MHYISKLKNQIFFNIILILFIIFIMFLGNKSIKLNKTVSDRQSVLNNQIISTTKDFENNIKGDKITSNNLSPRNVNKMIKMVKINDKEFKNLDNRIIEKIDLKEIKDQEEDQLRINSFIDRNQSKQLKSMEKLNTSDTKSKIQMLKVANKYSIPALQQGWLIQQPKIKQEDHLFTEHSKQESNLDKIQYSRFPTNTSEHEQLKSETKNNLLPKMDKKFFKDQRSIINKYKQESPISKATNMFRNLNEKIIDDKIQQQNHTNKNRSISRHYNHKNFTPVPSRNNKLPKNKTDSNIQNDNQSQNKNKSIVINDNIEINKEKSILNDLDNTIENDNLNDSLIENIEFDDSNQNDKSKIDNDDKSKIDFDNNSSKKIKSEKEIRKDNIQKQIKNAIKNVKQYVCNDEEIRHEYLDLKLDIYVNNINI